MRLPCLFVVDLADLFLDNDLPVFCSVSLLLLVKCNMCESALKLNDWKKDDADFEYP
jgi:hypothetical protein